MIDKSAKERGGREWPDATRPNGDGWFPWPEFKDTSI